MPDTVQTPQDLQKLRDDDPDLVIVDVRLEDDHAAAHLPGAVHDCVFEVTFLKRMADLGAHPHRAVLVYGHAAESAEARVAAAKLEDAGWARVHVLAGGLAGWRAAGGDVEGTGEEPRTPSWPEGTRKLDLAGSKVRWLGRNLLNSHHGEVGLVAGHVDCTGDGLAGGELELDMTRLGCDDLAGSDLHDVLIDHLKSDDFFDVENHPRAVYKIRQARWLPGAPRGAPNLQVEGELTLRGTTAPLAATLTAGVDEDGGTGAQGHLKLDRTVWGVAYGSGRLFKRVGRHLVNDEIELDLRLILAK